MAVRYAIASGNWSNPAIWNGGTLPGAGDDVYANGYNVTIDQDITVNKISIKSAPGITGGGSNFYVVSNRIINANLEGSDVSYTTLYFNAPNIIVTINGNIIGGSASSWGVYMALSNCTLSVNGTVSGGSGNDSYGIYVVSNSTVYVNGNVYRGTAGSSIGLYLAGYSSGYIVGDVYGSNVGDRWGGLTVMASANATVIGNLYGNGGCALCCDTTGIVTVTGSLYAGQFYYALFYRSGRFTLNGNINHPVAAYYTVYIQNSATDVTINGTVYAGGSSTFTIGTDAQNGTIYIKRIEGGSLATDFIPALYLPYSSCECFIEEIVVGAYGSWPVYGFSRLANIANPKITAMRHDGTFYTFGVAEDMPQESDVREGVSYDNGSNTGKLKVPPKSAVAVGVPTDDGVGSALLSGESILEALENSDNPLAERLRNVATVQSTAATINESLS